MNRFICTHSACAIFRRGCFVSTIGRSGWSNSARPTGTQQVHTRMYRQHHVLGQASFRHEQQGVLCRLGHSRCCGFSASEKTFSDAGELLNGSTTVKNLEYWPSQNRTQRTDLR